MSTKTQTPYGRPKNKTEQEARRLSISTAQLLQLFHQGVVPGVVVSDRIILFDPEKTDKALERHHALNQEKKENN